MTGTESGVAVNPRSVRLVANFVGMASWEGKETLDLATGRDDWQFTAKLTGTYHTAQHPFGCKLTATLTAAASGTRLINARMVPDVFTDNDCAKLFKPGTAPFANGAPLTQQVTPDAKLQLSSGNVKSNNDRPWGISGNLYEVIEKADPTPHPEVTEVVIQNLVGWSGRATYEDGWELRAKSAVPLPVVDTAHEYRWYVPPGASEILDSPEVSALLTHDNKAHLQRVSFTKSFITFFGCHTEADRLAWPIEDSRHWIRSVAQAEWTVTFSGDVTWEPDAKFVQQSAAMPAVKVTAFKVSRQAPVITPALPSNTEVTSLVWAAPGAP